MPTPDSVDTFLEAFNHPLKAEVLALRELILGADASIQEAIKWNVPSFHTSEHFATFHLRAKNQVQIVFHRGAKAREASGRLPVADPEGMLQWRSNDRAVVCFSSMEEIVAKRGALQEVVRGWIEHVDN